MTEPSTFIWAGLGSDRAPVVVDFPFVLDGACIAALADVDDGSDHAVLVM
jgi:hypothetical protein